MAFEVKQGLFQLGLTDNHAILGVPLTADFSQIRKRYMRIARRLHSDTSPFQKPEEKELATQLLAKLVSPAYNKFSKENERKEYMLLLKTVGDRVVKEQQKLQVQSEVAKQLFSAANYQQTYETLLEQLAKQQYESPDKALEVTGHISELNQVYLLRKGQKGSVAVAAPPPHQPKPDVSTPPPPPPQPKKDSFVEQACHRAEQLMATRNYAQAILELKDAVKREPENSRCHALLGLGYLGQNQPKLATPHIERALQLDPKQPQALEAKKQLEKAKLKVKKSQQKSGGGLFGGLFGGKKN